MRRRLVTRAVALSALTIGATSCGGDDDSTKACADIATEGRDTDDVKADFLKAPCTSPEGIEAKATLKGYDCIDGPFLDHNSYGWGYEGDTWHEYDEGETGPPEAEVEKCLGVIISD